MTTFALALGDLHSGSTLGVCPAGAIPLDDGGSYSRTKAQAWLTGHFDALVEEFLRIKLKRGDKRVLLLNGDLVDGDHHNTTQIVSRDLAVQQLILQQLLEPLIAANPDAVVVVRGTPSHVGKAGASEEAFAKAIARRVHVEPCPETGAKSHYHFTGAFGGVRIDMAHHGKTGTRTWTKGNPVNGLAADIFMGYALRGEPPPHLAIRSHCHIYHDTANAYPVRVLALPAFQIKTEWGHQKFAESLADVGGAILVCDRGNLTVIPKLYLPKRSNLWRNIA